MAVKAAKSLKFCIPFGPSNSTYEEIYLKIIMMACRDLITMSLLIKTKDEVGYLKTKNKNDTVSIFKNKEGLSSSINPPINGINITQG